MTEQDFRDKFNSIMLKSLKLELKYPNSGEVFFAVGVVVGATASLLAGVNASVVQNKEYENFFYRHHLRIDFGKINPRHQGSVCIGQVDPMYAYQVLNKIDNALDALDTTLNIAQKLDVEFTQNNWKKNWL